MKCHSFLLVFSLLGFLSYVAALSLSVQPTSPVAGELTTVTWKREDSDPQNLSFDLRFVQEGQKDVGLAVANIYPGDYEDSGTVSVRFPQAGKYKLVAVTGSPRFQNIGASKEVDTTPQPTASSTTAPSSTSAPPTSTPNQSPDGANDPVASPISGSSKNANMPVIVGGVIGGLLLLTLLVAAFIYVSRRRKAAQRRISFHKDMMVQRRSPDSSEGGIVTPYPFVPSPNSLHHPPPVYRPHSHSSDTESAYSGPPALASAYPSGLSSILLSPGPVSAQLGTGHIVPSPRGPRERSSSFKRDNHTKIVHFGARPVVPLPALPVAPPLLTTRQKELVNRMVQIQNQMNDLQDEDRRASSVSNESSANRKVVIEDMQKQLVWLSEVKDSKWALNETDIKPAGYSRYMTP